MNSAACFSGVLPIRTSGLGFYDVESPHGVGSTLESVPRGTRASWLGDDSDLSGDTDRLRSASRVEFRHDPRHVRLDGAG